MAHVLSVLAWWFLPRVRRRAWRALALALGPSQPAGAVRRVLREALERVLLDRLACLGPRGPAWRAAAASLESTLAPTRRHRAVFLSATLGWPRLLAAHGGRLGLRLVWLEHAPSRASDAAVLEWLGRVTLVDLRSVRRALARGAGVRLLLLLPDEAGRPLAWTSPLLGQPETIGSGPEPAERAAQQALDMLALLVRTAPELLDWTAERWLLRPEIARDGHAPWSRLAPWLAPPRPERARRFP